MGSSPIRGSSFFIGKVTALGVLCCFALFVCLTLFAFFFHLSFKTCTLFRILSIEICSSELDSNGLLEDLENEK